jgi:hypothetical protein
MLFSTPLPQAQRDLRLDFFRGIAMFVIFVSHVPGNAWVNWIPGRFGFSDSAEIFVFCSGMASAIAFGKVFEQRGFLLGSARILHRAWQVYWAHISIFVFIAMTMVIADRLLGTGSYYVGELNLLPFFNDTEANLLGLFTLTYVPNYFDILPMYLVILLIVPAMVAAHALHRLLPFVIMGVLWWLAWLRLMDLPAEPWSDRTWFFNPFSWQLIFFIGYALSRGWIPAPPVNRILLALALALVVLMIPISSHKIIWRHDLFLTVNSAILPFIDKTHLGPVRVLHFLVLAYAAYATVTLLGRRFSGWLVDVTVKVGQQSLPVFLCNLALARFAGIALDATGRSETATALINIAGCAMLAVLAYSIAWFKSSPWQRSVTLGSAGVNDNRDQQPAGSRQGATSIRVAVA